MTRRIALVCLFVGGLALLPAQTTQPSASPPLAAAPSAPQAGANPAAPGIPAAAPGAPVKPAPDPYRPEEFPEWVRQLRRAEIIAIGIFPFMVLGVSLGNDLGRYGLSGFNPRYAPGPFRQPGGPQESTQEQLGRIGISFGLSLLAAGIDFLLGQAEKPAGETAGGP